MTLEDYIQKYNNKFVEYHSYSANSKNQCTDNANQYIVEVLGLPAIIGTNAQQFPDKAGSDYEYILNTPTGIPQKGDLMIWSSADNVGHIAIFIDGDANKFNSFDQNYPTGTPCHIQSHTYLRPKVIGWLRAKKVSSETIQVLKKDFENLVKKSSELDLMANAGYPDFKTLDVIINSLKEDRDDIKKEYDKFVLDIVSKLNPTGNLAPVTDKNYALQLIDSLITEKDEIETAKKKLEDESSKREKALEEEIYKQEVSLKSLKTEVERLLKRVETAESENERLKKQKDENNWFSEFINSIFIKRK